MRTRLFVPIALLATAAFAQSPNAAGQWVGNITPPKVDTSKMTPAQKKQITEGLAFAAKYKLKLNLKGDKTFTMNADAMATPNGGKIPAMSVSGKWSQKGTTVTMEVQKQNGKAVAAKDKQAAIQTMIITPDGKKMTMTPKVGAGTPTMSIIYKRP